MSTSVLVRGTLHQRHCRVPTNDATSSHRLHSIERVCNNKNLDFPPAFFSPFYFSFFPFSSRFITLTLPVIFMSLLAVNQRSTEVWS